MRITGVFEVVEGIEEIGARPGDRLVVGEGEVWPVSLARKLGHADARFAFLPEYARPLFTLPSVSSSEYAAFRRRWLHACCLSHLRLL